MSTTSTTRGRRGSIAAMAATVVLTVGGTTALVAGLRPGHQGPPQPPGPVAAVAGPAPAPHIPAGPPTAGPGRGTSERELDVQVMGRSRPVGLAIPSIGVDSASIVDLGKEQDGTLEVPVDFGQPGWYSLGPAPGEFGPAVIAGHVDSRDGPGVFYRLGALRPGAEVSVTRADGSTARFAVDKVERYRKDEFPTVAVYGDSTHRSELRLITCGGQFNTRTGHYVDNVVAYAHLL